MQADLDRRHLMPLSMGPMDAWYTGTGRGSLYREREMVALQYRTEPEAIAALLPECYQPLEEATVTVAFVYCAGVEFMAGGGYSIATFMVGARFDGDGGHTTGNYPLVMCENDTLPILLGRERLGVHKIYAEISPMRTLPNRHLRCEASLWGHLLFGIDVAPLEPQEDSICAAASERASATPLLGYKYIPSIEGPPDAAYPICTPNEVTVEQLSLGASGEVFFGDVGTAQVPFIRSLVDMLKTLPVLGVAGLSRSRDSFVLRTDLSQRLR